MSMKGTNMHFRRPLIFVSILAFAAFSLLAAGCGGGGGSPGVANVASSTTTTTATTQTGLVAFAACMRSHGVPNFPACGLKSLSWLLARHAAALYSLTSPPRSSRRSMRSVGARASEVERASGGWSESERCGRCRL